MTKVYRFRPANDLTIEEIKENYLWFSRPNEFKDENDSNVTLFAENNEGIKQCLNRVFKDFQMVGEHVSYSGICCFTENKPESINWRILPGGYNGVFIEYFKEKIENKILHSYCVGDCFKRVVYVTDPSYFESSSDDNYDILWEKDASGKLFISYEGHIELNPRNMEQFFIKLFTTIGDRYSPQKELRIILGKKHFRDAGIDVKGYKIPISSDFISSIYYNRYTKKNFINKLKKVIPESIPLININEK